jgi:dihydroorotate dehydrogenase (fumarate)
MHDIRESIDLSTTYLGLKLRNPLVIGPGLVSMELHALRRLEEAGAAAVVVAPLFEEEIEADDASAKPPDRHGYSAASAVRLRDLYEYNSGPDAYLHHIEVVKQNLSIPVIGTLNGADAGEWLRFARLIEEAGADALELNIYFLPTGGDVTSGAVEHRYIELVSAARAQLSIPLAVKIGPFFSALPSVAKSLVDAGANGLVLFNRFVQSDIDLSAVELTPHLLPSSRNDLRLPLHWIAILRRQLAVSLAASGGIHFADDLVKALLVGADAAHVDAAVFRSGPSALRTMLDEVRWWFEGKHVTSLDQIKGSLSHRPGANLTAFERADYLRTLVAQSMDSEHAPSAGQGA